MPNPRVFINKFLRIYLIKVKFKFVQKGGEKKMLKRFLKDERAQGMTEYVLVVFLIALLAFVAVQLFGGKVKNAFNKAGTKLDQATKK